MTSPIELVEMDPSSARVVTEVVALFRGGSGVEGTSIGQFDDVSLAGARPGSVLARGDDGVWRPRVFSPVFVSEMPLTLDSYSPGETFVVLGDPEITVFEVVDNG